MTQVRVRFTCAAVFAAAGVAMIVAGTSVLVTVDNQAKTGWTAGHCAPASEAMPFTSGSSASFPVRVTDLASGKVRKATTQRLVDARGGVCAVVHGTLGEAGAFCFVPRNTAKWAHPPCHSHDPVLWPHGMTYVAASESAARKLVEQALDPYRQVGVFLLPVGVFTLVFGCVIFLCGMVFTDPRAADDGEAPLIAAFNRGRRRLRRARLGRIERSPPPAAAPRFGEGSDHFFGNRQPVD